MFGRGNAAAFLNRIMWRNSRDLISYSNNKYFNIYFNINSIRTLHLHPMSSFVYNPWKTTHYTCSAQSHAIQTHKHQRICGLWTICKYFSASHPAFSMFQHEWGMDRALADRTKPKAFRYSYSCDVQRFVPTRMDVSAGESALACKLLLVLVIGRVRNAVPRTD